MAKIEAFELWVWQKMLQEVERRKNSMDLAQSWNASEGRIDCTVKEIQRKNLMEVVFILSQRGHWKRCPEMQMTEGKVGLKTKPERRKMGWIDIKFWTDGGVAVAVAGEA